MKSSLRFVTATLLVILFACGSEDSEPTAILGCMDPAATNHLDTATEDDCSCEYSDFNTIGSAPATAEKNVLFEEFTGEWCGWCVDGTVILEELMEENPNRVFTSAIHIGDFLENTDARIIAQALRAEFYPSGIADRRNTPLSRELWKSKVNQLLEEEAKADLAIDSKLEGTTVNGVVYVDFKENLGTEDYYISVYVIESNISARGQENYYNQLNGYEDHPYFIQPPVLRSGEYTHNYVLRKHLGNFKVSPKAVQNSGVYKRSFSFDISSYEADQTEIIAVVSNGQLRNSLNVMSVRAGETANW
jgi:thiol-disulfide isomerase/thioredoxin